MRTHGQSKRALHLLRSHAIYALGLLQLVVLACPGESDGQEQALKERYEECKFDYCVHPLTGRLAPANRVACQILFGTVTNFTGGRMVELDSPAGHVIVVRDAAYRGSNGDEVEWMVRNYGKYTRENEDGESETLLMLDDVTMTPELFRRYFQAAYTLEGRPVTIPGDPDRTAPAGGESPDTAFKSTIRIDTRIGKINRKLHRLPSQFSDEPRKLKRLPSQFDDDPKGIQIRNPSKAP